MENRFSQLKTVPLPAVLSDRKCENGRQHDKPELEETNEFSFWHEAFGVIGTRKKVQEGK